MKRVFNMIIVDESGSMCVIERQALAGINETIDTVKKMQKMHKDMEQRISLLTFDSGHKTFKYDNVKAESVHRLGSKDYNPCGGTPLYDAIGTAISKLNAQTSEHDNVLVTIITDGYENASRTWNGRQIKSLVQELRQMGWTFTYIGADQDVEKVAGEIGVCNALRFSANVEETAAMFEKEGRSRTRFYDKVCCEMRAPDASLAESDDYFADDDTPEALEDILKSEAKGNR